MSQALQDQPRGGNPANVGQYSTRGYMDASGVELAPPAPRLSVGEQMARIRTDAQLIKALSTEAHVKYIQHDEYGDSRVVSGTVRTGFWTEDGYADRPDDFHDTHLRITEDAGFDRFVAVRDLEDAGARDELFVGE